ncbi:hypothetical protein KR222_003396 [Zaprionus bogoriensis]|nr:hypothetical protein KR222_003396 [Zaprionus bogoriensis]
MVFRAAHTLLFGIFTWHISSIELHLCGFKPDDRIIFPDDQGEYLPLSNRANEFTTNNSLVNTTNTTELPMDSSTNSTLEKLESNSTMGTPITVDNRILVDTLPVCEPGFQLRAGRCRKSA